jgi:hypothetical protein
VGEGHSEDQRPICSKSASIMESGVPEWSIRYRHNKIPQVEMLHIWRDNVKGVAVKGEIVAFPLIMPCWLFLQLSFVFAQVLLLVDTKQQLSNSRRMDA